MYAGFDWDEGNREKCRKHGVSLAEIEDMLAGSPRVAMDAKHSSGEDRFIAVGKNANGRYLFVAYAIRTKGKERFIRPVSARYMHRKEITSYEKSTKTED